MSNENVVQHFRKILKSRQMQIIFFKERSSGASSASVSDITNPQLLDSKGEENLHHQVSYPMLLWKVTHHPRSNTTPPSNLPLHFYHSSVKVRCITLFIVL